MSIQIGQKVKYNAYPEKSAGIVVAVKTVFGREYADVFFDKPTEKITVLTDELAIFSDDTPETKIKGQTFSASDLFLLRFFKDKYKSLSQEGFRAAANFKILPLPHQLLAVNFVLEHFKPRVLIADEVGLGKTIEAILLYEELKSRHMVKSVLIVTPSGLCRQWQEELKEKFSEDFAIYDKNTIASLKQLHGEETNIWNLSNKIITSIDFIKPKKIHSELNENTVKTREWHNKNVFEAAFNAGFDMVIFDEAHKLTKSLEGDETARYKIGKELSDRVPIFILLSATPHQGDSAKFKNLLSLIDPYQFYKTSDVTSEKVKEVTVRNNKRAVVDFDGNRLFKQRITSLCKISRQEDSDRIEIELYEAVTEYVSKFYNIAKAQNNQTFAFLLMIYQRMVSSSSQAILKSLSKRLNLLTEARSDGSEIVDAILNDELNIDDIEDASTETQLSVLEDNIEVSKNAELNRKYLEMEIEQLEKCVDLARKSAIGRNDAKFKKLIEIIDEVKIRENEIKLKIIIFTEFVETQSYLNKCLKNLGYETAIINGNLSNEEKTQQKKLFKEKAQILISTDAGGEGINLQFCRVMINFDLPWNPMKLEQRIGRIDRIGQEHDVKIINFQLLDTIEQYVRETIERKLEIIKSEFSDGEDKLADILSTLQDDFSFEKIYIDATIKRNNDAKNLEHIAQQIYLKAKQIINDGQLILPISELSDKLSISKKSIFEKNEFARNLLEKYLKCNNKTLNMYKNKKNVYYFEDPVTGRRINNVIFNQEYAVQNDEYELFSFNNPYMVNTLENLDEILSTVNTSKIRIKEEKFAGNKGMWFIYHFNLNNNIDLDRDFIISVFIDEKGCHNNRISNYLNDSENILASDMGSVTFQMTNDQTIETSANMANQKAEEIYYDIVKKNDEKIISTENKMDKYFKDREISVERMAIENIKQAKRKELQAEREKQYADLRKRKKIVPEIYCTQIAVVEFI
ncbi:MAG: hypothetical protein ACD_59C00074G0003 [uncultured bacterium]|nr:MAG: hypothetical protein ACD_59C00074G0003 [uncultured bacterium]